MTDPQAAAEPHQNDSAAAPDPKDKATSPKLERLAETIERAKHAADEALAPQRE